MGQINELVTKAHENAMMTNDTLPEPTIARIRQAIENDEPIGWGELKRWLAYLLNTPSINNLRMLEALIDERETHSPTEDDFDKGVVRTTTKFIKKIENGEYGDERSVTYGVN